MSTDLRDGSDWQQDDVDNAELKEAFNHAGEEALQILLNQHPTFLARVRESTPVERNGDRVRMDVVINYRTSTIQLFIKIMIDSVVRESEESCGTFRCTKGKEFEINPEAAIKIFATMSEKSRRAIAAYLIDKNRGDIRADYELAGKFDEFQILEASINRLHHYLLTLEEYNPRGNASQ